MKDKYLLEGFAPQRVLRHFEDLCAIPHGSGHEEALGNHVVALAAQKGYETYRDVAGNVLVRVPATSGYEDAAPFLLQGHMDMVLAKDDGVDIDLERKPVRLVLEGNILRADGTTLGADNGVGLCMMMALLDADDLIHPELELLFTTQEEVGMVGIEHFDMSLIRSRRMLNMDCGDPDELVIGAAGSAKYSFTRRCGSTDGGTALRITIGGLRGGHSGLEMGKNRASALDLAGRLLSALCAQLPVRLAVMETPGAGNSIPARMSFTVAVPQKQQAQALEICRECDRAFAAELAGLEENYAMTVENTSVLMAAGVEDTRAIADFMLLVPYDAIRRSHTNLSWVLCSGLLLEANYADGSFSGRFAIRANRDTYRDATVERFLTLCRMTGAEPVQEAPFGPAWPERAESPFREACLQLYRELFGSEMKVHVEHGGVEPSVFARELPDMDIVAFAPKSRGAHTTKEHLYVDSVEPFWQMLTALLERLCQMP